MSTLTVLPAITKVTELPVAVSNDDAVWRAWAATGRARELRNSLLRVKGVKFISALVLVTVAVLWSNIAAFDVFIRFGVALGAVVVAFQAFHAKRYEVTALFALLAVVYNPLVPLFGFAGDWQRALVAVSAVPFIISLAWPDAQKI